MHTSHRQPRGKPDRVRAVPLQGTGAIRKMHAPFTITPSKNKVDYRPPFRHGRRPPSESGEVGCNVEPRSLHSSVQEFEIRKLVSSRSVRLSELFIHLHWRCFSRCNLVSTRVTSGRGAVEVPHEKNWTLGCGGFVSAPD